MSNVARHARARRVTLNLSQLQTDGPVTLEIHDDGQGFDDAGASGMGLNNIRQRVEALGGKLEIQSAPGAGTTLRAAIGLTPEPWYYLYNVVATTSRGDLECMVMYKPVRTQ